MPIDLWKAMHSFYMWEIHQGGVGRESVSSPSGDFWDILRLGEFVLF